MVARPAQDAKELQNVEILKNSPYVNPGSKRTPYAQQVQKQHASYIISPYRCGAAGLAYMVFGLNNIMRTISTLGRSSLPLSAQRMGSCAPPQVWMKAA